MKRDHNECDCEIFDDNDLENTILINDRWSITTTNCKDLNTSLKRKSSRSSVFKELTAKRIKRIPLSMHYISLPIERNIHSPKSESRHCDLNRSKGHIRRNSTEFRSNRRNYNGGEKASIEWSSSDEFDNASSPAKAATSKSPYSTKNDKSFRSQNASSVHLDQSHQDQDHNSDDYNDKDADKSLTIDCGSSSSDECESSGKTSKTENNNNNSRSSAIHKDSTHFEFIAENISLPAPSQFLSQCTQGSSSSSTQKKLNSKERCRPGGYLDQFQKAMKYINVSRKFLVHDKKFGIRKGVNLRVLKIENSFGVPLATVISPQEDVLHIALYPDIAEMLTPESILESYVEQLVSFELECRDGVKRIILHPDKFIQP